METALKTDLPQSIRYNPYNSNQKPITLGTIKKTSWSLLPKWANNRLKFIELSRTDNQGLYKIEATLFLVPQGYSQTKSSFTKYIKDGQTTIRLETKWTTAFTHYDEIKGNITISMCVFEDEPSKTPQLSDDLLRLLHNPDSFPDATLICGTTEIPVHKCILSSRSPVFAAMFKNQMKEGLTGIVKIEDLQENVLQATLRYIYSGNTDHINSVCAGDLLFAADKYELKELKSICIDKLKTSMTVKNVFRILILGHLHDRSLKESAADFICRSSRFSEMELTRAWKMLRTQYPDLAIEVLTSFVKYLQS